MAAAVREETSSPPSYGARAREVKVEPGTSSRRVSRDVMGRGDTLRKRGGAQAILGLAPLVGGPIAARDLELMGGEAAILGEAVVWLHFEWGRELSLPYA